MRTGPVRKVLKMQNLNQKSESGPILPSSTLFEAEPVKKPPCRSRARLAPRLLVYRYITYIYVCASGSFVFAGFSFVPFEKNWQ